MRKIIDIQGERFGRLVVLSRCVAKTASRQVRWLCLCDCGREHSVLSANLRRGLTLSCGCLRVDQLKARGKRWPSAPTH